MKFSVGLDGILDPLQLVLGAVDRKHTLPILSFLHCTVSEGLLTLVGSDQELEVSASCAVEMEPGSEAEFTLPGRKLLDLCKNLSGDSKLEFSVEQAVELRLGRFRSSLAVLPAVEFPRIDVLSPSLGVEIKASDLRQLIEKVAFAMAQQDVRYFFNGMLFEFDGTVLRAVATNGQRLALAETPVDVGEKHQCILPRKAVSEILRLIKGDGSLKLAVNDNHLTVEYEGRRVVSRLIDATYPDYNKAIPANQPFRLVADRSNLRSALVRISILSNEVYRNVKLEVSEQLLKLNANNPLQEEAEENLEVEYTGEVIEIGFNVGYIIDVLSAVSGDQVSISLSDSASPILLTDPEDDQARYVISPMVI